MYVYIYIYIIAATWGTHLLVSGRRDMSFLGAISDHMPLNKLAWLV